jgi:hypothetical protein
MSQLVWVFAAGLVATSFAVAPTTWLSGVDGARQVGADAVVGTSTNVLGNTVKAPISWPEPSFSGTARDTLLRKSGDATWRAFAVTPWCVAELGSLAACERYGKAILDKGTDGNARKSYIDNEMSQAEGGSSAATVQWAKGKNPFGRIAVLTLGAIAATLFAFLTVSLAFTALMAFVGCMLLLVVGVLFTCLWAIPGRPRQWGMNWFEALLGLVLQSILALLVFSTTLALVTAVFGLTDTLGWLPVSGLAIAVLIAGFRLRRLFESLSTMMRPGMGSMVMGGLARRGAMGAVRRIMGAVGSRAASPVVGERRGNRNGTQDGFAEKVTSVRVFRQAPAVGALVRSASSGRQANQLTASNAGRAMDPSATGIGSGTGGRRDLQIGRAKLPQDRQARVLSGTSLLASSAAGSGSGSGRRGSDSVGIGMTTGGMSPTTGGGTTRSNTETRRARHTRLSAHHSVSGGRGYEARIHSSSASLRDGPPKTLRDRRRPPAPSQPRFREYSSVTKDGITVMVPTRR